MDDREKRKKIIFIVLGFIVIILLFLMINSCGGSKKGIDNPLAIQEISMKTKNLSMESGDTEVLSYSILPIDTNEVTRWVSSNESVATVDETGRVSALSTGTAIITLVGDTGVSDYTVVKVVSKEAENDEEEDVVLSINEDDSIVKVGSTKKLTYSLEPAGINYTEITWESSNNVVATINEDGTVTGLRSGTALITLRIVLGNNNVVTDTTTVEVKDNATLYLTNKISEIKVFETLRLSVAISDTNVSIVDATVKSSNEKYASVTDVNNDSSYITFDVKGVKKGDATIKVSATTSEGITLSLDIPLSVLAFTDLYISSGNKDLLVGEGYTVEGRLEPSINGLMETECSSSNTNNVTVESVSASGEYNGACMVTAIKEGTSTITMKIAGVSAKFKVTVVNATEPVIPTDPSTPIDPTTPTDPGVTPTGVLDHLIATLDKTEYKRLEVMGVLTVKAVDTAGVETILTNQDYVLINDFDSATLGDKKLSIVYTKDLITKTIDVSYKVVAGEDEKVPTTTTGGSASGGRKSGSGKDTAKTPVSSATITDAKGDNANHDYGIELAITDPDYGTLYKGLVLQYICEKDVTECNKDNAISINLKEVKIAESGDKKGTGSISFEGSDATVSAYRYVSIGNKEYSEYFNTDGTLKDNVDIKVVLEKTKDRALLNEGKAIAVGGELSIGQLKVTVYSDSATEKNGWYKTGVVELVAKGKCSHGTTVIKIDGAEGSEINFQIPGGAGGEGSTTFKFELYCDSQLTDTKTETIKFDNVGPSFGSVNHSTGGVAVDVSDNGSGIESVSCNGSCLRKFSKGDKNASVIQSIKYLTQSVLGEVSYSYTATDIAGNTTSFSGKIDSFTCYRVTKCNKDAFEDGSITNCKSCAKAGCPSDSIMVRSYNCKTMNNGIIEKETRWLSGLDLGPDSSQKNSFEMEFSGKKWQCEAKTNFDTTNDQQLNVDTKCIKNTAKGDFDNLVLDKNQDAGFNVSCEKCGCVNPVEVGQWSLYDGVGEDVAIGKTDANYIYKLETAEFADIKCVIPKP